MKCFSLSPETFIKHVHFLENVLNSSNRRLINCLDGGSLPELQLLYQMVILTVCGKGKKLDDAVLKKFKRKRKIVLKHSKSCTQIKKILKNKDLIRAFLKSIKTFLKDIIKLYVE